MRWEFSLVRSPRLVRSFSHWSMVTKRKKTRRRKNIPGSCPPTTIWKSCAFYGTKNDAKCINWRNNGNSSGLAPSINSSVRSSVIRRNWPNSNSDNIRFCKKINRWNGRSIKDEHRQPRYFSRREILPTLDVPFRDTSLLKQHGTTSR